MVGFHFLLFYDVTDREQTKELYPLLITETSDLNPPSPIVFRKSWCYNWAAFLLDSVNLHMKPRDSK